MTPMTMTTRCRTSRSSTAGLRRLRKIDDPVRWHYSLVADVWYLYLSASSLQPRFASSALSADLWFDTDLAIAPPTRVWAFFQDSAGELFLGGAVNSSAGLTFRTTSVITSYLTGLDSFGDLTVATDVPATVPEPATMLLLGTGLLALATRVRHNCGQR